MTKRFFAVLRYTAVAAMISSAFVFSGCSKDDDAAPVTFDGSIYAYITQSQFKQASSSNADTALDSLVMYLDKPQFAELKAALSSSTELTLFAPSNSAFKNLTALPGLADPDKVNQDIIKAVLAYHIVPGKKTSADLTAGAKLNTMYTVNGTADVITVNPDGKTLFTGSSNDKIAITTADQMTTNGVVHTTATVLIPTAIGGQLKSILGSLAATVLLGKDFTYMAQLIGIADAGAAAEATISGYLATQKNLTLLAIPNPVFVGLVTAKIGHAATDAEVKTWLATNMNNTAAQGILRNHILTKQEIVGTSSNDEILTFKNLGILPTLSSKEVKSYTGFSATECQCTTGVVLIKTEGNIKAPIVQADLDTEIGVNNGVMQVVGGIFLN